MSMTRQAATSDQAPAALGPYSQAIVAGGFVFCSGTAGIDPTTGEAPDGIEAQTEQALTNLSAVLEAAGASMADLVKTTIFYSNVDDFAILNAVYARHMPDPPPARSAPANVTLHHVDIPGSGKLARQAANEGAGHVAAADECDAQIFFHADSCCVQLAFSLSNRAGRRWPMDSRGAVRGPPRRVVARRDVPRLRHGARAHGGKGQALMHALQAATGTA